MASLSGEGNARVQSEPHKAAVAAAVQLESLFQSPSQQPGLREQQPINWKNLLQNDYYKSIRRSFCGWGQRLCESSSNINMWDPGYVHAHLEGSLHFIVQQFEVVMIDRREKKQVFMFRSKHVKQ